MADYTNISNVSVEPLAPVTSELMTSLRDNPIAIAEGALGSPKIKRKFQFFESTINISPVLVMQLPDNYSGGTLKVACSQTINALVISLSKDGGATYGSDVSVRPGISLLEVDVHFDTVSGVFFSMGGVNQLSGNLSNFGIGVDRVKLSATLGNSTSLKVSMEYTGGLV